MAEEKAQDDFAEILGRMAAAMRSGRAGDDYRAMAAEYAWKGRSLVDEYKSRVDRMVADHRRLEACNREVKADALIEEATTSDPGALARSARLESSLRSMESHILDRAADVYELESAVVKLEQALAAGSVAGD